MIKSQDRSGWFGASDTSYIMGNWNTKTFAKWWLEKQGLRHSNIKTPAMQAGTHYEHKILDVWGVKKRDTQIKIRRLQLRVNLDGDGKCIYEVKTYLKGKEFKVTKAYWQQAQVEMFVRMKPLNILACEITEEYYKNYFLPITKEMIKEIPIEFNLMFIVNEYLPRLKYLARCLKKGVFPNDKEYSEWLYTR